MADDLRQVADLTRATLVGEVPGPDIYYAALFAGPGFFQDPRTASVTRGVENGHVPWMQAIDSTTDLRDAVSLARGTSATAIKLYADRSGDMAKQIIQEAHRQHLLVWAHGTLFPASPQDLVDGGVDAVSHSCLLAFAAAPALIPRSSANADFRSMMDSLQFTNNTALKNLFAKMREQGTVLDATESIFGIDKVQASLHARHADWCTPSLATGITALAHQSGVLISAGTDFHSGPKSEWPEVYKELASFSKDLKMSNMEVIHSGTLIGAIAAGQQWQMGSITVAKLANFVILTKDPLEDIDNLKSIDATVKRGRIFHRKDYKGDSRKDITDFAFDEEASAK